jgi:hypothetical protein
MYAPPDFSDHADLRCVQRNLSEDEVHFIIEYGEMTRRTGVIFFHLRKRDIPQHYSKNQRLARLVGTTVVVDKECSLVITVYRNDEARKKDRRKTKYMLSYAF